MAKPIVGGLNLTLLFGVKLWVQTVAQKLAQMLGLAAMVGLATTTGLAETKLSGELLYAKLCAKCLGDQGQGVPDEHDEPLAGDWPIEKLTRVITRTMPDDDPKKCIADEAERVARYVFDAFYSPDAQPRNKSPRIGLARLTNRQYLHSIADLIGSFKGHSELVQAGGLKAGYYNSRSHGRNKNSIERTDATVNFQYGGSTPAPDNKEYKAEEFSMRWSGSVFAEETGDHEFIVTSENGVRLWVNDMNLKLIEGWVSSGELRELTGTLRLIGGRAYPLRLDFFKYKSRSASSKLEWHPPHGARQVIPARSLSPASTRNTFVLRQPFPPDDSSAGYERGSAVSKKWDEAAPRAERLCEQCPEEVHFNLHFAYAARRRTGGSLKEAYKLLAPMREIFPDEWLISCNLACYLCQMNRLDEADEMLAEARKMSGEKVEQLAAEDEDLASLRARAD